MAPKGLSLEVTILNSTKPKPGKSKIIQSGRVSKPEKWEGQNGQHTRAGNSAAEGFETVHAHQEDIWPLYPHSMGHVFSTYWRKGKFYLAVLKNVFAL